MNNRQLLPVAVVDASATIALLVDGGVSGTWAYRSLQAVLWAVPSLWAFESANALRRMAITGALSSDAASQAVADLIDLPVETWPYEAIAARAWELRGNLSVYDGSYVALAELLEAPLITLDRRLSHAPNLRCDVLTPN